MLHVALHAAQGGVVETFLSAICPVGEPARQNRECQGDRGAML